MESFINDIAPVFQWLVKSTLQASVVICIVLAVKILLAKKLTPRWHYILWMLVIVKMVMPVSMQSSFSIFNLIPNQNTAGTHIEITKEQDVANSVTKKDSLDEQTSQTSPLPAQNESSLTDSGESFNDISQPVIAQTAAPVNAAEPKITTANENKPVIIENNDDEKLKSVFDLTNVNKILSVSWLAGMLLLGIYVFVSNYKLWRIIHVQRPVTDSKILDLLEDCKAQMKMHAYLAVVETDRVTSPALYGFLRPRLLLPKGIIGKLSSQQLRHVFLHELAHLKRGDIYIGWLTALLQTLHWFNPLVWYAFYKMRTDRELACDELAISAMNSGENNEYGKTIVSLLEDFSAPQYTPGLAGILEEKSQLRHRISMIANNRKGSLRLSMVVAVLMVVIGVVSLTDGLAISTVELSPATAMELPEEIKPMAEVIVKWYNCCTANDVEGVRDTFHPDRKSIVSKNTLNEMNDVLSANRKWKFELLSVMWDNSEAMAVSKVFVKNNIRIGKDYSLIWPLRKTEDGQWKLLGFGGEEIEGMQFENARFIKDHPNAKMWCKAPWNNKTELNDKNTFSDLTDKQFHNVQAGETLHGIAEKYYGDGKYWEMLFEANKQTIGSVDQFKVGLKLVIPELDEVQGRETNKNASKKLKKGVVYVMGKVLRPGPYMITNDRLTLKQMIATVGGPNGVDPDKVMVKLEHRNEDETGEIIKVSMTELFAENGKDYPLLADDVIYVYSSSDNDVKPSDIFFTSDERGILIPAAETNKYKLLNGVKVELLGVLNQSKPDMCWTPDGTVLDEMMPRYIQDGTYQPQNGRAVFEFTVKLSGLPEDNSVKIKASPYLKKEFSALSPISVDGENYDHYALWQVFNQGQEKCDLTVSVACGEWKTVGVGKYNDSEHIVIKTDGSVRDGVWLSPLAEKPVKDIKPWTKSPVRTVVSLTHGIMDKDVRLIAVGKDGTRYQKAMVSGAASLSQSFSEVVVTTCQFDLAMKDIDSLELQVRPYRSVTFTGVALKVIENESTDSGEYFTVEGSVIDREGNGIPGVTIQIRSERDCNGDIYSPDIKTDKNGCYKYDKIQWPYKIGALWKNSNKDSVIFSRFIGKARGQYLNGSKKVDFQFTDQFPKGNCTVKGQVISSDDKPVNRYRIDIRNFVDWQDKTAKEIHQYTYKSDINNKDGSFEINGLTEGKYEFRIFNPEFGDMYRFPELQIIDLKSNEDFNIDISAEYIESGKFKIIYGRLGVKDKPEDYFDRWVQKPYVSLYNPNYPETSSREVGKYISNGYFYCNLSEAEIAELRDKDLHLALYLPTEEINYYSSCKPIPFDIFSENSESCGTVMLIEKDSDAGLSYNIDKAGSIIDGYKDISSISGSGSKYITDIGYGASVEFLGLRNWKTGECFAIDGSPIAPFDFKADWTPKDERDFDNKDFFELVTKVSGVDSNDLGLIKWNFGGMVYSSSANTTPSYFKDGIHVGAVAMPGGLAKTNLRLGLAVEPWHTILSGIYNGYYDNDKYTVHVDNSKYSTFGKLPVDPKGHAIQVTYTATRCQFRVIAIDNDGNTHYSFYSGSTGNDQLRQTIAYFKDLDRDDLKEYRFQVRDYSWVEVDNIALQPGRQTNISVKLLDDSPTSGAIITKSNVADIGLDTKLVLAGITEYPVESKQWWSMDGSLLNNAVTDSWPGNDGRYPEDGELSRVFAFKVDGMPAEDIYLECETSNGYGASYFPRYNNRDENILSEVQGFTIKFKDTEITTDITVGVGVGPWVITSSAGQPGMSGSTADNIFRRTVLLEKPTESNGKSRVEVKHLLDKDYVCRIIAHGKDGKVHNPEHYLNLDNDIRTCHATFNMKLDEIRGFSLQARLRRYVTFKNVSLLPGQPAEGKEPGLVANASKTKAAENNSGISKLEFRIVADRKLRLDYGKLSLEIKVDGYMWMAVSDKAISIGNQGYIVDHDTTYLLVSTRPGEAMAADGSWGLKSCNLDKDQFGKPAISVGFDSYGSEQFYALTKSNVDKPLAICIDGKIFSAPTIRSAIRDRAIITGSFSIDKARELAAQLKKGMPPVNEIPSVDPDPAGAADMMAPLYGMFSSSYEAIRNNKPETALKVIETALPQLELFHAKLKGSKAEVPIGMAIDQVCQIIKSLKDNDIETATALMNAINEAGPMLEELVENAALPQNDKPADSNESSHSSDQKNKLLNGFLNIGTSCDLFGRMLFDEGLDLDRDVDQKKITLMCKPILELLPQMQTAAKGTEFEAVTNQGVQLFNQFYDALQTKNAELAGKKLLELRELGNKNSQMFMKLLQPEETAEP